MEEENENIIHIPVLSMVKKRLIEEYGEEPIRATMSNELGMTLEALTGKKKEKIFIVPPVDMRNFEYRTTIAIILPKRLRERTCNFASIVRLNNIYTKRVKTEMMKFVEGMLMSGYISVFAALETYLRKEKISPAEYNLDTAKREWIRYRQRRKNSKTQKAA